MADGLGEHSLRYQRVAEALAPVGFDVAAVDHRGHGETTHRDEELGPFGPGGFGPSSTTSGSSNHWNEMSVRTWMPRDAESVAC